MSKYKDIIKSLINGENKNVVIKFEGTGGKLYEHIVKSSMNFDKCSLYPELIINTEIEKEIVEVIPDGYLSYGDLLGHNNLKNTNENNVYPYLIKNAKGVIIQTTDNNTYNILPDMSEVDVSDDCLRLRSYREDNTIVVREIDTTNLNAKQVAYITYYINNEFEDVIVNFEGGIRPMNIRNELDTLYKTGGEL